MSDNWVQACETGDIDDEDLIRFDHGGKRFAFTTPWGNFTPPMACALMRMSIWSLVSS
jgi:hypothetical protein